ncbi:MAG: NADH-quinone oxidoreductase subunit N [Thiohalomonadaceae bacterium]
MSGLDLLALLPIMLITLGGMSALLVGSFVPRHGWVAGMAAGGIGAGLVATLALAPLAPHLILGQLALDGRAVFFWLLIQGAALVVAGLAFPFLARRSVRGEGHHREFYVLLAFATVGAMTLAAASHVAAMFIGLELLSLCLFGLLAYEAEHGRALEAGMKYLVLAAVSSGVLLFGLALLYTTGGTLSLYELPMNAADPYVLGGMALVLVGMGFKLSLVPFHMWAPDVYEGAPAPVTAFIASVSKAAAAAWLLRLLETTGAWSLEAVSLTLAGLAAESMLAGNLLALSQENVKRLLAYSSVSHMGYLAVPLAAGGALAGEAVMFYAAAYVITVFAAFGVVSVLSWDTPGQEVVHMSAYRGLFWRRPVLAGALALALVSLAGIPVTAGFMAKFYVFAAGVEGALWWLVAVLIASSAIGLYFYLRLLAALFVSTGAVREPRVVGLAGGLLLALSVAIVLLGLAPAPLIDLLAP